MFSLYFYLISDASDVSVMNNNQEKVSCYLFLLEHSHTLALHVFTPSLPASYQRKCLFVWKHFVTTLAFHHIHLGHVIDSTYKSYYMVSYGCLSFWLASLIKIISRSTHVAANGIISFLFVAEEYSIGFIYSVFFIHLLMDI